MKRVFLVLELKDDSRFDLTSDVELDELAEDGLHLIHGVSGVTAYASWTDLELEEGPRSGRR